MKRTTRVRIPVESCMRGSVAGDTFPIRVNRGSRTVGISEHGNDPMLVFESPSNTEVVSRYARVVLIGEDYPVNYHCAGTIRVGSSSFAVIVQAEIDSATPESTKSV